MSDEWVPVTTPCKRWSPKDKGTGYRRVTINGKAVQAHRVAWEAVNGPIPGGRDIDHLCRTPWCVNPEHLEPVIPRINCLRGRSPAAENARKTHCKHGHHLLGDNLYFKLGHRLCIECQRKMSREFDRKKLSKIMRRGGWFQKGDLVQKVVGRSIVYGRVVEPSGATRITVRWQDGKENRFLKRLHRLVPARSKKLALKSCGEA